jgi:hypothetical protein
VADDSRARLDALAARLADVTTRAEHEAASAAALRDEAAHVEQELEIHRARGRPSGLSVFVRALPRGALLGAVVGCLSCGAWATLRKALATSSYTVEAAGLVNTPDDPALPLGTACRLVAAQIEGEEARCTARVTCGDDVEAVFDGEVPCRPLAYVGSVGRRGETGVAFDGSTIWIGTTAVAAPVPESRGGTAP